MRKLLPLLILCFITLAGRAQWISQATAFVAASRGVSQISIADKNSVWIAAYDGTGASTKCRDYSHTANAGSTWTSGTVSVPSAYSWSCIDGFDANTAWGVFYRVSGNLAPGRIYKTTDGGTTWSQQGAAAVYISTTSFPDIIYFWSADSGVTVGDPVNGEFEVYTTTDGGTTWNAVSGANIDDPNAGEYGLTYSISVVGNSIWMGTTDGRIMRSTDKGYTWTSINTGYPGYYVPTIHFANDQMGWASVQQVDGSGYIIDRQFLRTVDGGDSWTALSQNYPYHYGSFSYIPKTAMTLVSTGVDFTNGDLGSSYSLDGGDTWVEIDTGVQYGTVEFLDNLTGWAGGFNTDAYSDGIYKYDGGFVAEGIQQLDPSVKFSLYPNPSNGLFYFSFDASNNQPINIRVTDATGKEVFNKVYSDKSQTWLRSIDLSNLSKGIYFLELQNNGNRTSQKLVIE